MQVLVIFIQNWSKLKPHEGEPWPVGRYNHATVLLGSNDHQLLVTGGYDGSILNDCWILNLQSGRWKEVTEFNTNKLF